MATVSTPLHAALWLAACCGLWACSPAEVPAKADAAADAPGDAAADVPTGTDAADAAPDQAVDTPDTVADAPDADPCPACLAQPAPACQAWTCVAGACALAALAEGSTCTDADACTVGDACAAGACMPGTATACQDDGNPCTTATCDPATGACSEAPVASAVACEDGNPLTQGDTCCPAGATACKPGKCKPGKAIGECLGIDPGECEALKGNGNACDGILYCRVDTHTCELEPGGPIACDPSEDGDCLHAVCDPSSGKCVQKAWHEGQACEVSGSACAQSSCQKGQCVVDTVLCACASNADCAGKNGADVCEGSWYCDKSVAGQWQCKLNPATVVQCPHGADDACLHNACDPKTGLCVQAPVERIDCTAKSGFCKLLPAGTKTAASPCDDGNSCTSADLCQDGECVGGGSNLCTCKSDGDCAAKDDGDWCNGKLYCDKASGTCLLNPATVVTCPGVQDTACHHNTCKTLQDAQGLPQATTCVQVPVPDASPCNDGNPCTAGDSCQGGACLPTANVCTCGNDADCAALDDGNLCNGTLFCDLTASPWSCKPNPATVVTCQTAGDGPCATSTCDAATGKCAAKPWPDVTPCNADGNPCTAGDSCLGGKCVPGGNACACEKSSDCAKFEDGDVCNGTLYCDKSGASPQCVVNPATVKSCPTASDTACMQTRCDAATGLCLAQAVHAGDSCDADGNPCTATDTCVAGQCVAGPNVCACLSSADCKAQEDGDVCNGTLFCDLSVHACKVNPATVVTCAASAPACKTSGCDAATGTCVLQAQAEGIGCSDGSACTVGDTCQGGTCKPGTDVCACKTSGDCKDDGDLCNGLAVCVGGQCVQDKGSAIACAAKGCGGACDKTSGLCTAPVPGGCDDGNACTTDSCGKDGTCTHQAGADGEACAANQVCVSGQCKGVPAGMALVGGGLWMGCNAVVDSQCQADEKPQHFVTLSPVFVDRYEVTVQAYAACVQSGACSLPQPGDPHCNWGVPGRQDHPINCVTWEQAGAVCQAQGKRLPTEAEWELAARGACKTSTCKQDAPRWPWGNLPVASCAMAALFGKVKPGCDLDATFPVGARPGDHSAWGLYDLAGNVREWVQDGYDPTFYATPQASGLDPKREGSGLAKVLRGGSIAGGAAEARTSVRASLSGGGSPWVGVRCVKTP
jgi:sulfatase modifying factor 1